MSDVPQIYQAIVGVMQDIGAIEKTRTNEYDRYKFRGIDDVYNSLQRALVKNGVVITPELQEIIQMDRNNKKGEPMLYTRVTVKYQVACAADGSIITVVFPGESMDRSDKSVNKAMTAAYKYMAFELFCIPVRNMDDADNESPEAGTAAEPKKISALMARSLRTELVKLNVAEADIFAHFPGLTSIGDMNDQQYSDTVQMLNNLKRRKKVNE